MMMRLISRFKTEIGVRKLWTVKHPIITNVTNLNSHVCINCIHFIKFTHGNQLDKCSYFGNRDLVTGDITYEWASVCRIRESKCGESGKYFYSKHDKQNTI